jgi:large repetitive protein
MTVAKAAQTISFTSTPPASPTVGGTYSVTASGGPSGSPVVLTVDSTSSTVCRISGSLVSFLTGGSCVVDANQAGNANYLSAPQVQQTVSVAKEAQTISFTSTPSASPKVGGTYAVAAKASSTLAVTITVDSTSSTVCSIAGSLVTFRAAGTCRLDANQAGSAGYLAAAQAQQAMTVVKTSQSISFTSTPPGTPRVGGTYTVAAKATSKLAVTFTIDKISTSVCKISGAKVTFIASGTCAIDANQIGNATFLAAPQVRQYLGVLKALQRPKASKRSPRA